MNGLLAATKRIPGVTLATALVLAATPVLTSACFAARPQPALSASLADPWSAVASLERGDRVSVHLDTAAPGRSRVRFRGRFVRFTASTLTFRADADRFRRIHDAATVGRLAVAQDDRWLPDGQEREIAVVAARVIGGDVVVTVPSPTVVAVFRPNSNRWRGPLSDCTTVAVPGLGVGALGGWAAGEVRTGAIVGAAIGCAVGVMIWYADRSDTAGLEWDLVYERPTKRCSACRSRKRHRFSSRRITFCGAGG